MQYLIFINKRGLTPNNYVEERDFSFSLYERKPLSYYFSDGEMKDLLLLEKRNWAPIKWWNSSPSTIMITSHLYSMLAFYAIADNLSMWRNQIWHNCVKN